MKKVLLIKDYKNNFLISIQNLKDYTSMSVDKIKDFFINEGYEFDVTNYNNLDYNKNYKDVYVLYQTAEDIGTFYKDYIEDILLFLKSKGAILLPDFDYFRAHHNKNYMELLRLTFKQNELKTIKSKVYGYGKDAIKDTNSFPVIIKAAEGSGSKNVFCARNKKELKSIIKKINAVFMVNNIKTVIDFMIYYVCGNLFNKVQSRYRRYSFYRKKFIVQNMIDNLNGDYKVLYFGGKYFTLFRENRDNDFRASGSGKFYEVPLNQNYNLLDFAQKLVKEIDFPIIGMDIGFDGNKYHILEFQMIHIGPYTMQAADYWFEYTNGEWVKKEGKSDLEKEFCRSICNYIKEKYE